MNTNSHTLIRMISMNINLSPKKTLEQASPYELSENSLEKIKSHNESYKLINLEGFHLRSPKCLQRRWDYFWSKAIETDGSQARRHIVMVSKFKQAILSLREYCEKNDLTDEMHDLYARLLQKQYGEYFSEESIEYLENLIFHTFENLKFNIFIGCKNWNSGISDAKCRIENKENSILNKIDQSDTVNEVKKHIVNWKRESVLIKKLYKNHEYHNIRIEIQNIIESIMSLDESASSLKLIKTDVIERIGVSKMEITIYCMFPTKRMQVKLEWGTHRKTWE